MANLHPVEEPSGRVFTKRSPQGIFTVLAPMGLAIWKTISYPTTGVIIREV
jgi:hypothetical protein